MGTVVRGRSFSCRIDRFLHRLFRRAPFLTEADPIGPDEWLLRRVPAGDADYYKPSLLNPFQRVAFRPFNNDTDGISLFRELFISPRVLARTGRKALSLVARINMSEVTRLGMITVPTPDPKQPPGHSCVPDLSIEAMKKDKNESRELQHNLSARAQLAYDPKKT